MLHLQSGLIQFSEWHNSGKINMYVIEDGVTMDTYIHKNWKG